ncbi:hypothetical protein F5Y03DRAFT_405113 [Xylaria venustula]|nr:hypothetical protein F5Y03DRAFT_405113 [Xylaria venustula]
MYRFSYAPKRDYPYKWLTPLVYELVAIPADDISVLQAKYSDSSSLLKFLCRNSNVSCDYTTLPVNSEIFTKNYALPYTIRRVWQQYDNGTIENQDALPYREHALNDCNVTSVGIFINGKYSQSVLLSARSRKNPKTHFNIEGTYNLVDDDIPDFLKNTTSSPSLLWGQSLLQLYYLVTSHAYYNASGSSPWGPPANLYSGYINLTRQSTASVGGPDEVLSDDFFNVYCTTEYNVCNNTTIPSLSQGAGAGAGDYGSPYPTNYLARDKHPGQGNVKNITVPNMLADASLLANLTRNVTNEANAWLELQNSGVRHGSTERLDTSLAIKSFDPSVTVAPALGVNTSYFSTSYICQIPMLKPAGTRFIAILSSSLILLHTIWNIFWFVFNWIVLDRLQEEANNVIGVRIAEDTSSGDLDRPWEAGRKVKDYTQVNQAERHLE